MPSAAELRALGQYVGEAKPGRGRQLLDLLGQTWPARAAKGAIDTGLGVVQHTGEVLAGRADAGDVVKAFDAATMVMGGGIGGAPAGAIGSGPNRLYHGSPRHDLTELRPSARGALGPGAYFSPYENVAKRYAGPEGKLYAKTVEEDDYFQGMRSMVDEKANPYETWRTQTARLVEAADPAQRDAIAELAGKSGPEDGYQFYVNLARLFKSEEAAQELIRKAGYKGISGNADGPEWVHFGPMGLE
jgi:hypothetical protein